MNRILVALLFIALTVSAGAQTVSTCGPDAPLPVSDGAINTFVIPATQTYHLLDTAKLIGTVPAGCTNLWICASGPINYGDASVAVGLGNGGIPLTTQTSIRIHLRKDDSTPAIYMINQTSGATSTVRLMYAK